MLIDCQDNCDENVPANNAESERQRKSQKLELAFNLSTNVAYRLHDDVSKFIKFNNICQEVSFSYDIGLQDLNYHLNPGIVKLPSTNIFSRFNDMYLDRQIGYPLLTWQNKKPFNDRESDFQESPPKVKKYTYKIEKEIQNAIRLHYVNSSIWRSFLLMKTIREFVIFNQVCKLVKAFLYAGEACKNDEKCNETDEITFVQFENVNLHASTSGSSSRCTSQSSIKLNELADKARRAKSRRLSKKRLPKTRVFCSTKNMLKKLANSISNVKKPVVSEKQSCTIKIESISIGVGDSYVVSVDQESQVDNEVFVERSFETAYSFNNENRVDFENDELDEEDYSTKAQYSSHKDFKKSLKSLEEIIKSCQLKSDEESTNTVRDKPRKKRYTKVKNVDTQRKTDSKVKEVKQKNRQSYDSYKKECRKTSELPDMRKMYQIILENRLSQGVSFEYSTPDKSKVQLLFVNKSRDNHAKMY